MGTVFAISLEKGGVGKTTSTQALATEAAWDGKEKEWPNLKRYLSRGMSVPDAYAQFYASHPTEDEPNPVLVVDADPQRNITHGSGIVLEDDDVSTYEVLLNAGYGATYALKKSTAGTLVLPSHPNLAGIDSELKVSRETRLREALTDAEGWEGTPITTQTVDLVKSGWIDSPPNLGILTMNSLVACDYVLVPMQAQYYASEAMQALEETMQMLRKVNRKMKLGGIFLTMFNSQTNMSESIMTTMKSKYGELVFETVIPWNTTLSEAPAFGLSIQEYDSKCSGAIAYASLYQEIKKRFAL